MLLRAIRSFASIFSTLCFNSVADPSCPLPLSCPIPLSPLGVKKRIFCNQMRRWEKTIVKSIKSEKRPLHWNTPASPPGSDCIVSGDPDLVCAIRSLEEDYAAFRSTPTATPGETLRAKGTSEEQPQTAAVLVEPDTAPDLEVRPASGPPPTLVVSVEPDAVPDLESEQASGHASGHVVGQASVGERESSGSDRPGVNGEPDDTAADGALEPAMSEHAVRAKGGDESSRLPHEPNNLLYELPAVGASEPAMSEHDGLEAVEGVGVARAQSVESIGNASSSAEERSRVKAMVEKLLRTSNSVALAAARPLSIKPPPVLMVEEDARQVSSRTAIPPSGKGACR